MQRRTVLGLLLVVLTGAVRGLAPATAVEDAAAPSVAVAVEAAGAGRVRVRHAGGVAVLPERATRVCALAFVDELLCLGVVPVAVRTAPDGQPVDYLRDHLRGARAIRTSPGSGVPDLEAIAACAPEVILTAAIDGRLVAQLSRIAPTVVLRPATTMYRENGSIDAVEARLRDLSRVLGREPEAEAFLRRFDGRLAALRERVQAVIGDRSIAFLRSRGRVWRLYGHRSSFGGEAVFAALGLAGPAGVREDGATALDPERLVGFDADFVVVVADPTPGAAQGLARLRRHPLWRRIRAVREGHVHEVTIYRHWVLSGPLGKLRMAEDVAACILR